MKPAAFDYHAPSHLEEALALLAQHGTEASPLAGGQSLMPLLSLRRLRPSVLIDLNRVHELSQLRRGQDGLTLGAMTRQRALEREPLIFQEQPLLTEAARWMSHVQVRNRGTVGGSLAYAHPAAELPAVAVALGARLTLRSAGGKARTLDAESFFLGPGSTARTPEELLTEVHFPRLPARSSWALVELGPRQVDFALAGAVALLQTSAEGVCTSARLVIFGACDKPLRALAAERALQGQKLGPEAARAAAATLPGSFEPRSDSDAPAAYREELSTVLLRRAINQASSRIAPEAPRSAP